MILVCPTLTSCIQNREIGGLSREDPAYYSGKEKGQLSSSMYGVVVKLGGVSINNRWVCVMDARVPFR